MEKTVKEMALEIAQLMEDGKGTDVAVLDVSEINSWTDCFVIVTVASGPQWQGLYKAVREYIEGTCLEIHQVHKKTSQGDDWNLVDLGPIVVHLMSREARDFYELEKLWHAGKKLK